MAVSRRVPVDLALTMLDAGCAHDVAHDMYQSATHTEQAIYPRRFVT
ncbi:MAG TPA: hypothetical protein VLL06_00500 [Nitrospiraceae bacterium]|nr:hypothetical protein [Nitrospiraceae bacterium]